MVSLYCLLFATEITYFFAHSFVRSHRSFAIESSTLGQFNYCASSLSVWSKRNDEKRPERFSNLIGTTVTAENKKNYFLQNENGMT